MQACEVIQRNEASGVARGAGEQNYSFYRPILRGLSRRQSCMMLGANHVVRVVALKSIGYYHAHLTEDLITGMTMHSRRFKSVPGCGVSSSDTPGFRNLHFQSRS